LNKINRQIIEIQSEIFSEKYFFTNSFCCFLFYILVGQMQKNILFILFVLNLNILLAQTKHTLLLPKPHALKSKVEERSLTLKAKVGVACMHLETGDTFTYNNEFPFAMQSVYKFPQAIAILSEVDKGNLSLNQGVFISQEEMHDTWSPLRTEFPEANREFSLDDLLRYTVSKSDNNTCDVLFRLVGGPQFVNQFFMERNFTGMQIQNTEDEMHQDWNLQYNNTCHPFKQIELLKGLLQAKFISDSRSKYLLNLLTNSENSANRIKKNLPKGTPFAHKTGTAVTSDKEQKGTVNDVGIITLPNGSHLLIAILINQLEDSMEKAEALEAQLGKMIYDYYCTRK
jgi:beta-lactamase class A